MTYKECPQVYIGDSDTASLIIRFPVKVESLNFGIDDSYHAYYITDKNVVIPEHYRKVSSGTHWLKIYDDDALRFKCKGKLIEVYRAGEMGCIIRCI